MYANEMPPALARSLAPQHTVRDTAARRTSAARRLAARALLIVGIALGALGLTAAPGHADIATSFPESLFSDSFASGNTSAWTQSIGTGTTSVVSGALRLSNTVGQYELLTKQLSASQVQTSTKFDVRLSATSGIVTVAQARDANSSGRMWEILYSPTARAFWLYPYRETGSVEIYTGTVAAAAPNAWVTLEVRYNAATNGGAQLYVNGATQASWRVDGDFSRQSNYTFLQLWNDATGTNDFDNVVVAK